MNVQEKALEYLKQLIKFDTTNPPGNEHILIEYVAQELSDNGIKSELCKSPKGRTSLIAELVGESREPALILSSHVDVVPAADAKLWKHPPFSAVESEGCIWGRGTLDMKFKTAFDLACFIEWAKKKRKRTLKLVLLADEECGGEQGVRFLAKFKPEFFKGAIVFNESGGFNYNIAGQEVVLLQAGEKSRALVSVSISGASSHASIEYEHNAIRKLKEVLTIIEDKSWRFCLTPITKALIGITGQEIPLEVLQGGLAAMVMHTITPTIVSGGNVSNMSPDKVKLTLDCRIIPIETVENFFLELKKRLEKVEGVHLEILDKDIGYQLNIPSDVKNIIVEAVEREWGEKYKVVDYLMPAGSDNARYYQAGAMPIGFAPLLFAEDFPGFGLIHSVDERVPVNSFQQGLKLYARVLEGMLGVVEK